MSESFDVMITSYVARGAASLALGLLLYSFFRHYGKSYLQHWSRSWFALAAFYIAGGTAFYLLPDSASFDPPSVILAVVAMAAGWIYPGYLAFGSWELARRRPVRLRTARRTIPLLGAAGALLAVVMVIGSHDLLPTLGLGLWFAAAATGSLASAWLIGRTSSVGRGIGKILVSTAFLVLGLHLIHEIALLALAGAGVAMPAYATYLGLLDFLLQGLIGLGMITILLEDEREAAVLASYEIEHLAYHDALTGLANRTLFFDRLILSIAHAQRQGQQLAVIFLDIDRFKEINDSLGHSVGDTILKSVAERMRRCVRSEDTVARFAGDEFTLLLPKISSIEDAARVAQKILETLRIPFDAGDQEMFISASIGISIYPSDGTDAETLVRNADTAMYRAKEQGRDNYQIYAPAMNAQALQRLALENMLRRAVAQNELVLHYQPLIDVRKRTVFGVEALLRWNHPELGLLSPAHFISAAEVSGLIIPIGDWVLQTACAQMRVWQKKLNLPLAVAVNLSARQFQQPDLVERIRDALDQSGLPPDSLVLEITESNAMQNADNTVHTLRELKKVGVRISMDDFGTGYSSLNYLKRFPIDTLKLDQSFVRGINIDEGDAAIATAVISLAHSLKLRVVAEGVETAEQMECLEKRDCDGIQGFYFSAPLPAASFEQYVLGHQRIRS